MKLQLVRQRRPSEAKRKPRFAKPRWHCEMPSLALCPCPNATRPSPALAGAGLGQARAVTRLNRNRPRGRHTGLTQRGGAVLASEADATPDVDADDAWQPAVVEFWTGRGCSEREAQLLVATAAVHTHLRDVAILAGPATILSSLVPGASVAAMVSRSPDVSLSCNRLQLTRPL